MNKPEPDNAITASRRVEQLLADCQALLAEYRPDFEDIEKQGFEDCIAHIKEPYVRVQGELEHVLSVLARERRESGAG